MQMLFGTMLINAAHAALEDRKCASDRVGASSGHDNLSGHGRNGETTKGDLPPNRKRPPRFESHYRDVPFL